MNTVSSDTRKFRHKRLGERGANTRLRLVYRRPASVRPKLSPVEQAAATTEHQPILPLFEFFQRTAEWLKTLFAATIPR